MVTDIEMGAMGGLQSLCEDRIAKDILEAATDMLGALDTDTYYSASDDERDEFLREYADEINGVIKDAVMNDTLPKRKAADWEILTSFKYGDREIFMGENPNPAKEDERYIVGEIVMNELFGRYENCVCESNYNEIAKLYSQRIQEQIQKVQEDLAKFPFDRSVIGMDSCDSIRGRNIEGDIVVIDPKAIKREYVGADRQLWLAQSGFGCSPNGSGRKVYCKNLFTGAVAAWQRQDILGTIKSECIPKWVNDRMTDNPVEVLFTFGSSVNYPFQWGYVSITAPTVEMAIEEFRRNWPDRTPGVYNYCDHYFDEESVARIKESGNGGKCHKSIDITLPVIEGKTVDVILSNATERAGGEVGKGNEQEISLD